MNSDEVGAELDKVIEEFKKIGEMLDNIEANIKNAFDVVDIKSPKRVEKRIYHNSDEYDGYLDTRFDNVNMSNRFRTFFYEGKYWAYQHTSFDSVNGNYDLIYTIVEENA